jgi:proteasome alpha subunit
MTFGEHILVDVLVKKICDFKQIYTQHGGIRPFGTALLVAGVDERGTHLFETDPSGALMAYKAFSIGAGRNTVKTVFEEKYQDNMSLDASIALGIEALSKVSEGEIKADTVEIGFIQAGDTFRKMEPEQVASRMGKSK